MREVNSFLSRCSLTCAGWVRWFFYTSLSFCECVCTLDILVAPQGPEKNSLGHGAWCLCVQRRVSQWKHTWIHRQRPRNWSYQLSEHWHSGHPVFLFTDNNSSIEECRQVNLELACNLILNCLTLTLSIVISVYVEFIYVSASTRAHRQK